jgi:ubiquinone/menaquinone biosynthesis C-methylase UbiE
MGSAIVGWMTDDPEALWVDRPWLTGSQYKTDANLAARQSIYAYQRPKHDIARQVIDLAGLDGNEPILDVGCGNGAYLAELARRGHAGPVLGLDLSSGMLKAARDRIAAATQPAAEHPASDRPSAHDRPPRPGLVAADATAIPLPDDVVTVALAPHMLYHVHDAAAAVRELRRITRPGGRVLVVLNGENHLRELRDVVDETMAEAAPSLASAHERLTLEAGERLMAEHFGSITRHDFTAELVVPDPGPVADYVQSTRIAEHLPESDDLVTAVITRLGTAPDGSFHITTHSGCLICS